MGEKKSDIALVQGDADLVKDFIYKVKDHFNVFLFDNGLKCYDWIKKGGKVDAIVTAGALNSPSGTPLLKQLRNENLTESIPFVVLVNFIDVDLRNRVLKERVSEAFDKHCSKEDLILRLNWLINNPITESEISTVEVATYQMPVSKRLFDVILASLALLALSPILLLIALLIKIESRGPIFYIAKRVGTGYQIFNFYKFRSMKTGADKELKNIVHLNQYKVKEASEVLKSSTESTIQSANEINGDTQAEIQTNAEIESIPFVLSMKCKECLSENKECNSKLFIDGKTLCEKNYLQQKRESDEGKFIKISNDPRVTRIGKFIRNTSIDELPQLLNVIKGDMSIVGNRPLPLYEAEKITTDALNQRFMAPAGITGLWQISKRGTANMSEEERMNLDNEYAKNISFWGDVKIILKTIPALLQKENV